MRIERMYKGTKTWNPFKGCRFNCSYCKPSFQRQSKRQKSKCLKCYNYEPHTHPERLTKIPSANTIFVAGNGDITFCNPDFVRKIIETIKEHNKRCPNKSYFFQSKNPVCFKNYLDEFPQNVIILTTLETNRDQGYDKISKAPKPSIRYRDFLSLNYPRKVVTIEPIMDFDQEVFLDWIVKVKPEYVWIGFNSHPKEVPIPEPSKKKVKKFIKNLKEKKIEVKGKDLRGMKLGI